MRYYKFELFCILLILDVDNKNKKTKKFNYSNNVYKMWMTFFLNLNY